MRKISPMKEKVIPLNGSEIKALVPNERFPEERAKKELLKLAQKIELK